jgi:glycosyltransferase involved in cell wall biosynthesis
MLVARVTGWHRAGGMCFVVQDRARALAALGHDVHVVTTSWGVPAGRTAPATRHEEAAGLTVHHAATPAHQWSGAFAGAAEKLWRQLNPEILHLDSWDRDRLWWAGCPCRTAVSCHGFGFGSWLTRWNLYRCGLPREPPAFPAAELRREAAALADADVVLAVSRWEWRMLRDQYGLPQVKVVYNPIGAFFFQDPRPAARPPGGYFLCAAVSGQAERGFARAREACAKAGVPFEEARDVPREQMPAHYDGAKALLLLSSFCQGFDLSVAESRARGVPAILSPTGSYLDEAGEWDTHAELGDVDALAAILRDYQPPAVPANAADVHRPEAHARAWLAAVAG